MAAKDSIEIKAGGSVAYLLLIVPALLAALGHWSFMPQFVSLLTKEFDGVALPALTNLVTQAAPVVYSLPVALLGLSIFARRQPVLRHPAMIGGVGACLALALYVYGLGTTLPLITLLDSIGNR